MYVPGPATLSMGVLGAVAGRVAHWFGSKPALIAGAAVTAISFILLAVNHHYPHDMLISAGCSGAGWRSRRSGT